MEQRLIAVMMTFPELYNPAIGEYKNVKCHHTNGPRSDTPTSPNNHVLITAMLDLVWMQCNSLDTSFSSKLQKVPLNSVVFNWLETI